jgi:RNA 3'-terminal phosphate cyclase (ATP)
MVTLDGSHGEGGGQILRSALSLSLLTGRPFRIERIRANREKPGLRPQHLMAVRAAAELGRAEVRGDAVGSRELTFRPGEIEPRDLSFDIGTAGATSLVLHTLFLPLALRAERAVRLTLTGGTFNDKAPSFPFLERTWAPYMTAMGLPVTVAMPSAGFYPIGGGRLEAWIEPARRPRAVVWTDRPPLGAIRGVAGVANLPGRDIAQRMAGRAVERLAEAGFAAAEIAPAEWPGRGRGAAIALAVEHGPYVSTFVGLGERGKPAEVVADEAVAELVAYERADGAVDPHSADQLLLPLALAEGRSVYTVSEVTEHLRTNARTTRAFLDRPIRIDEPTGGGPGRVVVG